jgi:hypothetical protein
MSLTSKEIIYIHNNISSYSICHFEGKACMSSVESKEVSRQRYEPKEDEII